MNQIIIKAFPRLHLTLIAMHDGEYRKNGGFGFTISTPYLELKFQKSSFFNIIDTRQLAFSDQEISRALEIVQTIVKKFNFSNLYTLTILGNGVPTHSGFGTSTALRLAMIEALFLLNEYPYLKHDVVQLSKRGHTSGIGINTYFEGGYVFDIGVLQNDLRFLPSSHENPMGNPLVLNRGEMPNWQLGICIPKNITAKTEDEEKDFFKKTCPITSEQTYQTLYHVIYGLVGSIQEDIIDDFNKAVISIQNCAWKKAERELYGQPLLKIEKALYDSGATSVGMSSLGPALFFFSNDLQTTLKKARENLPDCLIFETSPHNHGRQIIVI